MITTILFDLDDTLFDFHRAEAAALSETLRRLGLLVTDAVLARYSGINREQWELLERGLLTREQVLLRRYALLFAETGIDRKPEDAQALYEVLLSEQHMLIPGAEAVLAALKPRYRLCAVSNGTASIQHRRLRESGLEGYFSGIFISQELGADKPSPVFYDRCFASPVLQGVPREDCIAVGDSLTSDILGAANAGIRSVWYNPKRKSPVTGITADRELCDLTALPALLSEMQGS